MDKRDNFFLNVTYFSAVAIALFTFISFSITAVHHVLALVAGIYFTYKAIENKKFYFSNSSLALLLLAIFSVLSVLVNDVERPLWAIFKNKYFLIPLLTIFAYKEWLKKSFSEKKVRLVINIFLVSIIVANVSGLIALHGGFNPLRFKAACHATRNCGMYGMFMTFGYGMMFVMMLLTGLLLFRKRVSKYLNLKLLYAAFLIGIVGFILSYARGALLGFFIALPFFYFKRHKRKFIYAFCVIILVSGISYLTIPKVNLLFTDIDRITSVQHRFSQYEAAVKVFLDKPILGIGYKNFEPNVLKVKMKHGLKFGWRGGHAHSNFFEHLAATGILGFLALLFFHIFWGYEMYKRDDILAQITFPFVMALFISGQFQYTLGDGENLFIVMFIYSLSQVRPKDIKS